MNILNGGDESVRYYPISYNEWNQTKENSIVAPRCDLRSICNDIMLQITEYLDTQSFGSLILTIKAWSYLSSTNKLPWKIIMRNNYGVCVNANMTNILSLKNNVIQIFCKEINMR